MKILVFDVPAESGGALSILDDFYNQVKEENNPKVQWMFVLGIPTFRDTSSVTIKNFGWIKKSWFHRLYFDYLVAPKVVKDYNPDLVFSLQNTMIPRAKRSQILYVHQPLPFITHDFKITENLKYWIYQKVIGRLIMNSLRKVDYIIVQTHWMKKSMENLAKVNASKIVVVPPHISIKRSNKEGVELRKKTLKKFIYPASGEIYKNHKVIVEAVSIMKSKNLKEFEVIFTLNGNENKHIRNLYKIAVEKNLPIKFTGPIERNKLMELYTETTLLFPSYVETFGLPLLEAKMNNGLIITTKEPFTLEILNGYNNAYFFNKFDSSELAEIMSKVLFNQICIINNDIQNTEINPKLGQVVLDLYSALNRNL